MSADNNRAGSGQMNQLESVRQLALSDPGKYPSVLPAIIPVFQRHNSPSQETRTWGAEFIAEAFASPTFALEGKQETSVKVLPLLKELLELPPGVQVAPPELAGQIKSAIQAAASIYPLVFRHIVRNPQDTESWQLMSQIKSNILRRMDQESPGIRICCVRFIERIVQTQTPGVISDPRRPESNETSLALVPSDHPLLKPQNLEAEAHGLLDRALGILQEHHSDALLITATLNGLGGLMRTRATVANRILNAVLNFNPFKLANSPMTPANKLMMKSMEKTVIVFLHHILKRAPQHPLAGRIEGHVARLQQMRKEILDGLGVKRPAEEPVQTVDSPKRQKTAEPVPLPEPVGVPPLPNHRPISLAELFTLTTDQQALSMNVKAIPPTMAAPVLVNLLRNHVSAEALHHAANTVRSRYQQIMASVQPHVQTNAAMDDDDDYEPTFDVAPETTEQIKNRLDADARDKMMRSGPAPVAIYHLPRPPPMTPAQLDALSYAQTDRMFETLSQLMANKEANDTKRGFHDSVIQGSMNFQDYFRMIVRCAIRPFAGSPDTGSELKSRMQESPLSDHVRQRLLQFILSDWQRRVGFAVTWFTEEYIAEKFTVNDKNTDGAVKPPTTVSLSKTSNYKRWMLRFLSDLSVYLGSGKQDLRFLVRFVGEIPLLDEDILSKIAIFADDPERVSTVGAAVRYLVSYRPSIRGLALDALETVWKYEGHVADSANAKMLKKFRQEAVDKVLAAAV